MSEEISDFSKTSTNNAEKIASDTEKTEFNTEKIVEIIAEKIKLKGQRGPDKGPRRYNSNSLRNLKQYQNIIAEETKTSNNGIWILLVIIAVVIGILIWRIYEWLKEKYHGETHFNAEQV